MRRDVTPGFVVAELITCFNAQKIERPGYTRLQRVIGEALSAERHRLADLLAAHLDVPTRELLAQLLVRDETLSELAALKPSHNDPFDRLLVAQAICEPLRFVTYDSKLKEYSELVEVM